MSKKTSTFKNYLIRIFYFIKELGIDLRKLIRSPFGLFRYYNHLIKIFLKNNFKSNIVIRPYINDWYDSAGVINDEYFIQDLYFARKIYKSKPLIHYDVQ